MLPSYETLNALLINRLYGFDHCLVRQSVWTSSERRRVLYHLLKLLLQRLFLALDFLHAECRIILEGQD